MQLFKINKYGEHKGLFSSSESTCGFAGMMGKRSGKVFSKAHTHVRLALCIFVMFLAVAPAEAQWPRFHGNSLNTGVVSGSQGGSGDYTMMWQFKMLDYTNSSPALADLDGDGLLEVVIASHLENLNVLNGEDGSILWTYPISSTDNNSSPVIADLDGDDEPEISYATTDTLYVFEGETGDVIWSVPAKNNAFGKSPSTGDLDGDGMPEVIYSYGDSTRAYDGETGTVIWTKTGYWVSDYSSPVAEDTDSDGTAEVMVCLLNGNDFCLLNGADGSLIWQTPAPASFWSSAPASAFADIDLDGDPEIVSCAGDNDLYALNAADGLMEWNAELPSTPYSSPCLLDLDGNDSLEIVVGVYQEMELRAYTCSGDSIWLVQLQGMPLGTPAVADMDGDEELEIIQTTAYPSGAVYIFDAETGTQEWILEYGIGGMIGSSPAIGDLNGDGFYDFVFGCHDRWVYAFTSNPQGIEQGSSLRPVFASVAPNPFASEVSIKIELPDPGLVSIRVYDLSGRFIRSLEDAELGTGDHVYTWDGSNRRGEMVSTGLYICRIQHNGIVETVGLCRMN
ncbi:MAG: PQQ-binding-like beta-propeller repeat protein [Candidatus Aegiribacteria sp.]|nr:PQQ-binding-like beta-propeller repeat protein [Candidatus Aegiribacteria sp.]